jgi:hypothetical protein
LAGDDGEIPAEGMRIKFPEVAFLTFLQKFIVKHIPSFLTKHGGLSHTEAVTA